MTGGDISYAVSDCDSVKEVNVLTRNKPWREKKKKTNCEQTHERKTDWALLKKQL